VKIYSPLLHRQVLWFSRQGIESHCRRGKCGISERHQDGTTIPKEETKHTQTTTILGPNGPPRAAVAQRVRN
jgi:hypothetical protein